MLLEVELKKRQDRLTDQYALLGTEIKMRRNALSKTQNSIAHGLCSISYLSKVENNEIRPNPVLLEDICKRVYLTPENMNQILNTENIFDKIINAFYEKDYKTIYNFYKEYEIFKNYRAKLIKLSYYVTTNEDRITKRLFKELDKVVYSADIKDLILYSYLEIFYKMKHHNYIDCWDNLNTLIKRDDYDNLKYLAYEDILQVLFDLNSSYYLIYHGKLYEEYKILKRYDKLNLLDLQKLKYYYQNNNIRLLENELEKDYDKCVKNKYQVLLAYKTGIDIEIDDEVSFENLLYLSKNDNFEFIKRYDSVRHQGKFNILQETLLDALYLYCTSDETYYDYLVDQAFKVGMMHNNVCFTEQILKMIKDEAKVKHRYKCFLDLYDEFNKFKDEVEKYC